MSKGSVPYRDLLIEELRNDPEAQMAYLQACFEENYDMPKTILTALRTVAAAQGFGPLAKKAKLGRESLYKTLPENGKSNPRMETIFKIIDALEMKLSIEPKESKKKKAS